jgi:hypothetical protein
MNKCKGVVLQIARDFIYVCTLMIARYTPTNLVQRIYMQNLIVVKQMKKLDLSQPLQLISLF